MDPRHHTIKVTEEEIQNSTKEHAGMCMVANAIRKCIPGAESIDVTSDTTKFNLKDPQTGLIYRYCYDTSGKAGKEIRKFDDNENIEPFCFKLDARQAFSKLIKSRGTRKTTNKKAEVVDQTPPCKRERRSVIRRRHGLKINE